MSADPDWLSKQDAVADERAWIEVCSDGSLRSPERVCRAARHHNWRTAPEQVQGCKVSETTFKARDIAGNWTNTATTSLPTQKRFVTHALVKWSDDTSTVQQVLQFLKDPLSMPRDFLTQVARDFHQYNVSNSKPLWLAEEDEMKTVVHVGSTDWLERVCALGLFHFLPISEVPKDAVLAFVYQLEPGQVMHQPDWRHGYPGFYFAAQPSGLGHGFTRDLRDGQLKAKEWVVPPGQIDPRRHLVHVDVARVGTPMKKDKLPSQYWQVLGDEIAEAAQ
ncbi:MAG: hypothetical protein J0L58_18330 [Burkholderiales bacterium]|nr:hypothetical protein [Burkholderiales bacterium]